MVLAVLCATQAGEEALGLVGRCAVVRVGEAVVDAPGVELGVQIIPVRGLIGVDRAALGDALADDIDRLLLTLDHEGQRPAVALTHDGDDPALA